MPASPTYRTETNDQGETVYICCHCEGQGAEHHATDPVLFEQHMHQRHDGRLEAAVGSAPLKKPEDADHPQGGPPGQTGEHPDHPHGGPPGQTGDHPQGGPPGQDKPEEDEPHVAHPIVDPDAPYVEHHEEPKP